MRNVNLDISSKFFIFIQRSNLKFTKKKFIRDLSTETETIHQRKSFMAETKCDSIFVSHFMKISNNQCLSKKVPLKHTKDIRSVNLYVL